jgi:hypothetical protein
VTAKEPGWYPDPFTQGRYERYFTGDAWTDETHPEGGPPAPGGGPPSQPLDAAPEPDDASKSSRAAVSALAAGLAAFFAFDLGFVPVLAWIYTCAVIAMFDNEEQCQYGLAVAGFILSGIGVALFLRASAG